jgi:hypothetical protein
MKLFYLRTRCRLFLLPSITTRSLIFVVRKDFGSCNWHRADFFSYKDIVIFVLEFQNAGGKAISGMILL